VKSKGVRNRGGAFHFYSLQGLKRGAFKRYGWVESGRLSNAMGGLKPKPGAAFQAPWVNWIQRVLVQPHREQVREPHPEEPLFFLHDVALQVAFERQTLKPVLGYGFERL
jgi:hypothetical protein